MSISETNQMAEFEREIYVNMLLRDIQQEREAMEKR
jgi:hypothetical protein